MLIVIIVTIITWSHHIVFRALSSGGLGSFYRSVLATICSTCPTVSFSLRRVNGYKMISQIPSNPGSEYRPNCGVSCIDMMPTRLVFSIPDVIAAGRRYGVPPGDLYGSLYFYLRDQLCSFSERLRTFKISFHVFDLDASELARRIKRDDLHGQGIPNTIRFDRIDVSNIIDYEYLGIPKVLSDWGPLIAKTQHATLIAYFMNWVTRQRGGNINTVSVHVLDDILGRMTEDKRVSELK